MNPKTFILLLTVVVSAVAVNAHDFESNGIYYNILEDTSDVKIVEVTFRGTRYDEFNEYSGTVEIPETVEYDGAEYSVISIGDHAFEYCDALVSVSMPKSVYFLGNSSFEYCCSLSSVKIPEAVTSIGTECFFGCDGLTSITLPVSLSFIGEGALASGPNLANIFVEEGNPYYCSIDGVLFSKDKIEIVAYPSGRTGDYSIPETVKYISDWAFCICKGLTSVNIPETVTHIGNYAFIDCFSLTSVDIPDNVTYIGSRAFAGTGLTSVTIPSSITAINIFTFCDCHSLVSVDIPESVTMIDNLAFYGCNSLRNVILPGNVSSIGLMAFKGCQSLMSITSLNPIPPTCDEQAFEEIDKELCTLHVPAESADIYKAVAPWNEFIHIDSDVSLINTVHHDTDRTVSARYNLEGKPVNADYNGVVIETYSDGQKPARKVLRRK